jgi:serine/threonine-protein kinase RsbW
VPAILRALLIFFICSRIRPLPHLDSLGPLPITYNEKVNGTKELSLPSRIESVDEAAMQAEAFARELGLGDEFLSAIDLAVRESVANAVKHGNKFDEGKMVEVNLASTETAFTISVRDFGSGFSEQSVPDPTDPENLLKANGRGILFMRTFMDEVEWTSPTSGGTIVTMRKNH